MGKREREGEKAKMGIQPSFNGLCHFLFLVEMISYFYYIYSKKKYEFGDSNNNYALTLKMNEGKSSLFSNLSDSVQGLDEWFFIRFTIYACMYVCVCM